MGLAGERLDGSEPPVSAYRRRDPRARVQREQDGEQGSPANVRARNPQRLRLRSPARGSSSAFHAGSRGDPCSPHTASTARGRMAGASLT
jgi:hypothetical protein